jgi:hypothetical protein
MKEAKFIDELGEVILPRTKTPGAKDARAVRYIDAIRPLRFTEEENLKFKADLNLFMEKSREELGRDFTSVEAVKKLEWVKALDKQSFELFHQEKDAGVERPFYMVLKEQIAVGYFNSEIVAKEYFAYDPNPGGYDPCLPYSEIGRAWAL